LFDSRSAIIGAREWGMNAEARSQLCNRRLPAKRRPWISCVIKAAWSGGIAIRRLDSGRPDEAHAAARCASIWQSRWPCY